MSLDLFNDKISDYGVIQKVCHSKNRNFKYPLPRVTSFVLDSLPPCRTQKSNKLRAKNKSKFDGNFRPYIC